MVPANGRGSYSLLGFRPFLGYKLLGFRDYYHRGLCRVSFSAIAGHALTSYLKPLCNFPHCSCPSLYKAPSSQHISWIRSKTYRSLSSPPWLHSLGAPIPPYLFTKFPRTCWLLGWGLNCTYHLGLITLHPAPQIPPPPSLIFLFTHYPQVLPHLWLFPISAVTNILPQYFPTKLLSHCAFPVSIQHPVVSTQSSSHSKFHSDFKF